MATFDTDSARWAEARAIADHLAQRGVDPLDPAAARLARTALVRRFVADLLALFAIVAVVAGLGLMVLRAVQGDDPLDGRAIWIASGALLFLLVVVALRSVFAVAARAYEAAWASFLEQVWPGAGKGDDFGSARLRFVEEIAAGGSGAFPSAAPGRRA